MDKIKSIFAITTTTKLELDKNDCVELGSARTIGFFPTEEEAVECVKNNCGDMWEHTYDYAVVEQIFAGIYSLTGMEKIRIFKYNEGVDQYEEIDNPNIIKNIGPLVMG